MNLAWVNDDWEVFHGIDFEHSQLDFRKSLGKDIIYTLAPNLLLAHATAYSALGSNFLYACVLYVSVLAFFVLHANCKMYEIIFSTFLLSNKYIILNLNLIKVGLFSCETMIINYNKRRIRDQKLSLPSIFKDLINVC